MSTKLGSCFAYLAGYTILGIIVTAVTVGISVGVGAIVGAVAPNLGVSIFGPMFCPPDTTPTLITEYGAVYRDSDGDQRQDVDQFIRCETAQGTFLTGRGEQYQTYWYGSWIVLAVALELLALVAWLVLRLIGRLRRGNLPQPAAGT